MESGDGPHPFRFRQSQGHEGQGTSTSVGRRGTYLLTGVLPRDPLYLDADNLKTLPLLTIAPGPFQGIRSET